jgi:hypothetical protein
MNEVEGLVVVPVSLTEEQLGLGGAQVRREMLESVNRALEKIQKDGRSREIIKRWLPPLQMNRSILASLLKRNWIRRSNVRQSNLKFEGFDAMNTPT